jgi:hypothetical protein
MKNNFYFFRMMRMREELAGVYKKAASVEEVAILSLRIVQKCLLDFREQAGRHDFETKAEEMLFIKVIKPELSSYRIFYMELFSWWKDRPKEKSDDAQKAYWTDKVKMINAFCEKHRQFSLYRENELKRFTVELAAPENRSVFHQREAPGGPNSNSYFNDTRFSRSEDETAATLMAYARLSHFCSRQIEKLSGAKDNHADSEAVSAG